MRDEFHEPAGICSGNDTPVNEKRAVFIPARETFPHATAAHDQLRAPVQAAVAACKSTARARKVASARSTILATLWVGVWGS